MKNLGFAAGMVALALVVVSAFWYLDRADDAPKTLGTGTNLIGREAPAFRLPVIGGGELDSASLKGHPVIINFWASWCEACRDERAELMSLAAVAKDSMVGIATNDKAEAAGAAEAANPHGYRVALDAAGDVATRYQVEGIPQTFLLDAEGKVLLHVGGTLKEIDVIELRKQLATATAAASSQL